MQIRNSSNDGSQPRKPLGSSSEKELGKPKGEGVQATRGADAEKAAKAASRSKSNEVRQGGDSFQRSKPSEDPGVDVGERLREARTKARGERVDNARTKDTEVRLQKRIANARQKDTGVRQQQRIEGARADHSEAAQADRMMNARAKDTKTGDPVSRAKANFGNLSRESVKFSGGTRSLTSELLQGAEGVQESVDERSQRIEQIRTQLNDGSLNSVERARQAADRMLGGQN